MQPSFNPVMGQTATPRPDAPARHTPDALMRQAKELEVSFLSEMLDHAGLDQQSDAFGGGAGEEQFSSFLREEQARLMVEKGGIGLAETLFRAMGGRADGA